MPPASSPHNELVRYSSVSSHPAPRQTIKPLQLKNQWGVDAAYFTSRHCMIYLSAIAIAERCCYDRD
jgi:hypothetical protein